MLVYLTHPQHGTHIAYDQSEVDRCKANGWVLRDEKKPAPVVGVDVDGDGVIDKPFKKRGRPAKAE